MSNYLEEISRKSSKKPHSIKFRVFRALFLILLYSTICIAVVGLREDILNVMQSLSFWLEFTLILLTLIFAVILSVMLATPGQERRVSGLKLKITIASWVGLNIILTIKNPNFYPDSFMVIFNQCFLEVFIISFIPSLLFTVYNVKKGVFYPKWLGLNLFLLSAMASGIFLQMSCPSENSFHSLGSHIFPIIIVAFLGAYIFKYLLKKK